MIYELYGLPGAGKTTLCEFVNTNYNIKNPMLFFKKNFIGKAYMHLFWHLYNLNVEMRNKKKKILEILENVNCYTNCIDDSQKITRYIDYMMFSYYIEKKYNDKNIIIDEGIVHYCMALYAEFNVEKTKLDSILNVFKIESRYVLGIDCELNTVREQIKKRNRKETAIDFLNDEELMLVLKRYKDVFDNFALDYKALKKDELLIEIKQRKEKNEV